MQKKSFLIVFIVFFLIVSIYLIVTLVKSTQQTTVVPQKTQTTLLWDTIKPGTTTTEELPQLLGQEKSTKTSGSQKTLFYASNLPYNPHEVVARDDRVSFVKEMVSSKDKTSLKERTKTFTTTPTTLYSVQSRSGRNLYVYPSLGVAFLANKGKDYVFEVWRFPKTTISDFLQLPQAAGYSTEADFGGF